MNIASIIDHTKLNPDCSAEDVKKICEEAIEYQFSAVCIPPYYVKEAAQVLEHTKVKVATVVGFPMGYAAIPAKVEEIKRAIDDGVDEVDVVANICAIKNSNWSHVKNDIDSMTRAVHLKGKVIKVILETSLLTKVELKKLCAICCEVGVDYVKTSTGYNGEGATEELVRYIKENINKDVKLKASGGIRSKADAMKMVAAGADRLGCSSSIQIVNGA